jgi:hypothetical protein
MGGGPGGMFGGEDLSQILEYTEAHGGGAIAVDSQSGASAPIIEEGAEVAGIGGFSGKESSVSASWLDGRIDSGAITWIYTSGLDSSTGGPGLGGGDSRTGSESAIDTVVAQCTAIPSSAYSSSSESTNGASESTAATSESAATTVGGSASSGATLYKCGDS